ncbi:hypothetical protein GUITHDRAFT_42659, partial [Guillardia theta CCMP2712]
WNFVVGLVGKPSAGKSTLFNALVNPVRPEDDARMESFPFTTILPNTGQGYFTVPCPSPAKDVEGTMTPAHGFAGNGERLLPIQVIDVAGLVPGAYQGRGHGNAFLNDLCGADVLIHVVDASGGTDKGGNPTEASFSGLGRREEKAKEEQDVYRPSDDVAWVRNEIHRWIYNNIQAKWASVVRLGVDRLVELLSGYHASRAVAAAALKRMGLRLWMPIDLHRLVAHFLRVRFPILLALNKCDHPDSEGHVQELLRRYDKE